MRGRAAAHLLATGQPCRRKVAVGEDSRPRPRCRGHGAHVLSGKQTPEGRQRIANATRRRMLASGRRGARQVKPPLPWRESLRTARARPKPRRWRNGEQRSSGSGTRTPSSAESGSSRACGSGSPRGVSDTTKIGQNPTVSITIPNRDAVCRNASKIAVSCGPARAAELGYAAGLAADTEPPAQH